jgi:hypothetical protein
MDVGVMAECGQYEPRIDESRADDEVNRAASTAGTKNQLYKELSASLQATGAATLAKRQV